MITDPLSSGDLRDLGEAVADFTADAFPSGRVRAVIREGDGVDRDAWAQMVELGYAGAGLESDADDPDDPSGAVTQFALGRALGARLAPTPYLSTTFAGVALRRAGGDEARRAAALRTSLVDGGTTLALVLGHGTGWLADGASPVQARRNEGGWELDGAVDLVLDGATAEDLLVLAHATPTDASGDPARWGLFLVRPAASGVSRTRVATVDGTRGFARLSFERAQAEVLTDRLDADDIASIVDELAVHLAAEMVGSGIECLRLTIAYLKTRHQFSRPIGSFQALKHRVADLAVAATVAQELVFSAAVVLDSGDRSGLSLAAPLALGRTAETVRHITEEGIQLHGGIGFAQEMDVGLHYKRAISDLELIASPADAYARLDTVRGGLA